MTAIVAKTPVRPEANYAVGAFDCPHRKRDSEKAGGAALSRYLPRFYDRFFQSLNQVTDFIELNVLISANCHSGNLG